MEPLFNIDLDHIGGLIVVYGVNCLGAILIALVGWWIARSRRAHGPAGPAQHLAYGPHRRGLPVEPGALGAAGGDLGADPAGGRVSRRPVWSR